MSGVAETVPVTAIITAYQRPAQTIETLRRIAQCQPAPDEILVHVDDNQAVCASQVRAACPNVIVHVSQTVVGPGGARNTLVAAARNELIASFDDDSYPIDADYFARAQLMAGTFPNAALFAARIYHLHEQQPSDIKAVSQTSSFGAGGVMFRRSAFLEAGGFVPLAVAYAMEEEDLALRLLDRDMELLFSPWLRVFHDTDLTHHSSAKITAGTIANLALLAWLRYPKRYWPYGVLQVANRVVWCLRAGRRAGVLSGLTAIPGHLARHGTLRRPVSLKTMQRRFAARDRVLTPFDLKTDVMGKALCSASGGRGQ